MISDRFEKKLVNNILEISLIWLYIGLIIKNSKLVEKDKNILLKMLITENA